MRIRSKKPLLFVVFGTSVTAGEGPTAKSKERSYTHFLQSRLRTLFPAREVRIVRRAFPGTTSSLMRHCMDTFVPERADAYLIEYVGYLRPNAQTHEDLAALIDGLRARCPEPCKKPPAIMLLAPLDQGTCVRRIKRWRPFDKSAADDRENVRTCVENEYDTTAIIERVGAEKLVPVLSERQALRTRLEANGSASAKAVVEHLKVDYVHPSPAGHRLLSELVERLLLAAVPNDSGEALRFAEAVAEAHVPAAPSHPRRRPVCAFGVGLRPLVLGSPGWNYTTEYSKRRQPKPGFIAHRPGATLNVCFRQSEDDVSSAREWSFGYLTSYEKMGMVRVECVRRCSCGSKVVDAHRREMLSEPLVASVRVVRQSPSPNLETTAPALSNEDCECIIRLTTLRRTNSGGHKFKLLAILTGIDVGVVPAAVLGVAEDADLL